MAGPEGVRETPRVPLNQANVKLVLALANALRFEAVDDTVSWTSYVPQQLYGIRWTLSTVLPGVIVIVHLISPALPPLVRMNGPLIFWTNSTVSVAVEQLCTLFLMVSNGAVCAFTFGVALNLQRRARSRLISDYLCARW
ncbi:MAG TPA: hypothetical protein VEJ87_11535 [Acidimicrobiales bacterium]|nr:hypothetical protein [Acidimicrobiales bacterium]